MDHGKDDRLPERLRYVFDAITEKCQVFYRVSRNLAIVGIAGQGIPTLTVNNPKLIRSIQIFELDVMGVYKMPGSQASCTNHQKNWAVNRYPDYSRIQTSSNIESGMLGLGKLLYLRELPSNQ